MNLLQKINKKYWDIMYFSMKKSSHLGFKSGYALKKFINFLNKNNRVENVLNVLFDLMSISFSIVYLIAFYSKIPNSLGKYFILFGLVNIIFSFGLRDINHILNKFETIS